MADPSDSRLMDGVTAGDRDAFSVLLRRHWQPLVHYADGLLTDPDGAYDAVQEAFIRLWRGRAQWRSRGSVRAWLFRTVRNLCISHRRKRSVRTRFAREERTAASRPRTPLQETEDTELRAAVAHAVRALSTRRREAFTLFYLRDLSYRETAEVMGVREQTVANYLQAALAELRETLKDHFPVLGADDT